MADGGNRRTVAIIILLYILIAFGIILFIITKYREKNVRCNTLNSITSDDNKADFQTEGISGGFQTEGLPATPLIQPGGSEQTVYVDCLVNYHIKSAYNCCAVKSFRNSFVSSCALKNCLRLGARCLDFEIYSVGNKAVIGASSKDLNINTKETFNHLDFADMLTIIKEYGFGDNPSNNDFFTVNPAPTTQDNILDFPILLHLRIKTKNRRAYDNMAESLFSILGDNLMDPRFTIQEQAKTWGNSNWYTNDGTTAIVANKKGMEDNLIFAPMIIGNQNANRETGTNGKLNDKFFQKVIVIFNIQTIIPSASTNNTGWEEFLNLTKASSGDAQYGNIVNYINLISPSPDCNTIRNFTVENATAIQKAEIQDEAKYRLLISIPTIASASINYNFHKHIDLGIQMPCLSFQNLKDFSSLNGCGTAKNEEEKKKKCDSYLLKYLRHFQDKGNVIYKRDDKAFKLTVGAQVTGTTAADYSQTSIIYKDSM